VIGKRVFVGFRENRAEIDKLLPSLSGEEKKDPLS
jgi:hypothetical protein